MTGLNHGLTGAAIALTVKNPVLAVPLSFASHYIQDAVPHFDYFAGKHDEYVLHRRFNVVLAIDAILSLTLMIVLAYLFPSQKWIIWGCMAAAASPDIVWAYYFGYVQRVQNKKIRYGHLTRLHKFVQWSATPQGIIGELAWATILIALISNINR
ncbi:MAG: hypothetical protein JWO96_291 [Candidatus Saccharibacteria bacterium]|nr:hypothetical protein [Candidatus Saccharibacteria bacterium]